MMKSNQMLFCAMALFFLFGFNYNTNLEVEKPQSHSTECFYPADLLRSLMDCSGCEGVRLYNAEYPKNANKSLMVVSISNGADVQEATYHLFEKVESDGPVIVPIVKNQAVESCSNIGNTNCFAVSLNTEIINGLLAQEGAMGVSFIQTTDSKGNATIQARSAYLSRGVIYLVNGSDPYTSDNPCPTACGQNSNDYLFR